MATKLDTPPNQLTFPVSDTALVVIQGSELWQRPERYSSRPGTHEASAALHSSRRVRRGRGTSHVVTTTPEAAEVIRDYCHTVGSGFLYETDPETRADGRALMRVAERIAQLLHTSRHHPQCSWEWHTAQDCPCQCHAR